MALTIWDMDTRDSKMRKPDRVLELKVIDKKAPLSGTGLVDKRLFTGENKLHAIKDPELGFWSFKYENGVLPGALKDQNFTSFRALFKYAEEYFKKRNIEIREVLD